MVTLTLFSCKQQEDYRKIRSQVVSLHDKAMKDADLAYSQYKILDSVRLNMNESDTVKVRKLMENIEQANHGMEMWMDHFEPDASGKGAAESVQYFKVELNKINKLDDHYKKIIVDADHYLDSLHALK